jgi:hypothetical protein
MNTKVTFNPFHFFQGNTPQLIEKIGNIALILATLGAIILGLPATFATAGLIIALPPILLSIAKIMIAISVMIKTLTKCFGVIDNSGTETQGTPVSTTTLVAPDAAPAK